MLTPKWTINEYDTEKLDEIKVSISDLRERQECDDDGVKEQTRQIINLVL